MITPSFSPTATERVLPKLALDFTTASLDARITFTRTTDATHPATYVGSNGYITAATDNQPRFDYNPVTLVCKGLLIEESRANLFTNSNNFSGAGWTATNVTINGTQVTSPDGTANATPLIENSATGQHNVSQVCATTGQKTLTVYAKVASGTRYLRMVDYNPTNGEQGATYFNLNTGTVANGPGAIQNAGNGFYRCSITTTTTVSSTYYIGLATSVGTYSYTGDGTSGVYIYGAQIEAGAFATSYIPTTTTALTRNADVATMTGTNFSSWYNATQGTLEAEFIKYVVNTDGRIWWIDDGSINNVITMSASAGGKLYLEGLSGGVYAGNIQNGTLVANTTMKACVAYSNATTEAASLAAASTTTGSLTLPSSGLTRAAIGYQASIVGTYFNGWIRKMNYYPQRLTNNEVQAFSK